MIVLKRREQKVKPKNSLSVLSFSIYVLVSIFLPGKDFFWGFLLSMSSCISKGKACRFSFTQGRQNLLE